MVQEPTPSLPCSLDCIALILNDTHYVVIFPLLLTPLALNADLYVSEVFSVVPIATNALVPPLFFHELFTIRNIINSD